MGNLILPILTLKIELACRPPEIQILKHHKYITADLKSYRPKT